MRTLVLIAGLAVASVAGAEEGYPETPFGYAEMMADAPQQFANWCRKNGGQVSRDPSRGKLRYLNCGFKKSPWGVLLLTLSFTKTTSKGLDILYSAAYFEATDAAIRARFGPRNRRIEAPDRAEFGWEAKFGGRRVAVMHYIDKGFAFLNLRFLDEKINPP